MPPNIISIGEVLWDLFSDGERFGGAPANFACHAAILSADVTMVSAVGNDRRGREAIAILREFGIDTSLIQVDQDAPTGTVGVETDAKGKPKFVIHEGSAWDRLAWAPSLTSKIAEADAVYFGTLVQRGDCSRDTIRRVLDTAKSAHVLRILDINLRAPFFDDQLIRESIERADILKLSDDEFEAVVRACGVSPAANPGVVLRSVLKRFKLDSVIMTRGAEGALFVSSEGIVEQPGVPAEVVDTVGAGDSFVASFVLGLLRGETAKANLKKACETASVVCTQAGAVPKRVP